MKRDVWWLASPLLVFISPRHRDREGSTPRGGASSIRGRAGPRATKEGTESEEEGEDGGEHQEAQALPSRGSIWISVQGQEVLGLPGQPPRAHSPRQSLPTEPGQLQGSPGEVDGSKDYFFLQQQQPGCNSPATTPTQAPSSRGTAPGLKAGRVLRSAHGLLSFPVSWLFSPRVLSLSMIQGSGGIVISPW